MKNAARLVLLFALSLLGCTRNEDSKISIQLPEAGSFSQKVYSSLDIDSSSSTWNGVSITSSTQVDCYLVAVSSQDSTLRRNRCMKKDSEDLAFEFGLFEGGVPAGSTIQLSVPSGPARTIYLLGMDAESGYCTSFKADGPTSGKISYPRLLTQVTTDLTPGENVINLTVPSDLSNLTEIDECQVESSGEFKGDPMIGLFGNQRDGDLTISSGSFTIGNDGGALQYNNGSVTRSPNSNFATIPSTKYFSANMAVNHIDNSTGKVLTLNTASLTADHFQVGDEILWHVSQGTHTTLSPDDNACGGGSELYRGRFDFAKITAIDFTNKKITLSGAVSPNPISINNSNFAGGGNSSTDHCRIQVLRVPAFDDLNISGTTTLSPPAYGSGAGIGGIIAFRARRINLTGSLNISASNKGFQGAAATPGAGVEGLGSSTDGSSNGAGGGANTTSLFGGGGAHAGAGGNSLNGDADGGTPILYCIGATPCRPITDKKFFFGGSGGSDGTNAGGHGGGVIILHAYEITGSANFYLKANGESIPSTDAGGGAGGAVHFTNVKYSNASALTIEASGGTNTSDGGGGGGGVIERRVCALTSVPSSLTETVIGGTSGFGSAGTNGLNDSANANEPLLCGL